MRRTTAGGTNAGNDDLIFSLEIFRMELAGAARLFCLPAGIFGFAHHILPTGHE